MKYTCIREVVTVTGHQEFQVEANSLEDAKRAFLAGEAEITHEELSVEHLEDWDFDEIEETEEEIKKSHIDYLNDIYGAVNGRDMLEIFEITQKIPDPAEFGKIAKEIHSQAVKPYIPGPLKLCQNVFAEINNPTPANDGEWTEPF